MENFTNTTFPISGTFADAQSFFDAYSAILSSLKTLIHGISNGTMQASVPTEEDTPPSHKAQLLLYDILIPLLGAVIILVNLAVVISSGLILKKGQQPRSTYMFLGNVALTDLVTGVAVLFGQLYPIKIRNHYICAIQIGMIVSSTLASIYSVGLIAVDRYLFILHGLQYQVWVYPLRVRIAILSTWIVGCIVGFLPLMGWYGDTDNGRVCWFILLAPKELILLTVIIGIIPILVVILLYSVILYRALNKIVQLREADTINPENQVEPNDNGLRIFRGGSTKALNTHLEVTFVRAEEGKLKNTFSLTTKPELQNKPPNKWKAIKVVMFTTGSFIITWSPYFIASLMYGYCYDRDSPRCHMLRMLIASPLAILGFTNSLINPVIYAWWHKGFRTFVKKKYEGIRMKKRAKQDAAESNRSRNTSTAHSVLGSKASSSSNLTVVSLDPENANSNIQI